MERFRGRSPPGYRELPNKRKLVISKIKKARRILRHSGSSRRNKASSYLKSSRSLLLHLIRSKPELRRQKFLTINRTKVIIELIMNSGLRL